MGHWTKKLLPVVLACIFGCADSQRLTSAATDAGGAAGLGDSSIDGSGLGVVPENCDLAAQGHSSCGCQSLVLQGSNMVNSSFPFTVVASNPTAGMATVNVERGGAPIVSVNVPPHGAQRIDLPWIPGLKGQAFGLLYACETGKNRVAVLDTNTGSQGASIAPSVQLVPAAATG